MTTSILFLFNLKPSLAQTSSYNYVLFNLKPNLNQTSSCKFLHAMSRSNLSWKCPWTKIGARTRSRSNQDTACISEVWKGRMSLFNVPRFVHAMSSCGLSSVESVVFNVYFASPFTVLDGFFYPIVVHWEKSMESQSEFRDCKW